MKSWQSHQNYEILPWNFRGIPAKLLRKKTKLALVLRSGFSKIVYVLMSRLDFLSSFPSLNPYPSFPSIFPSLPSPSSLTLSP